MFRQVSTALTLTLATGAVLLPPAESEAAYDTIASRSYNQLCPTWTGGDREYNGHGPEVTTFAGLGRYNLDQIWLRVYMHQIETTSDWSEAELDRWFKITERYDGTQYGYIWADTGGGWTWVALPNGTYYDTFDDFYVDTNHSTRTVYPADSWLYAITTNGDTGGNDIGNCTSDDAYITVTLPTLYFWYE